MKTITTSFPITHNLVLTDSTDKVLGILPCSNNDITERLRQAISEDVCISKSGIKFLNEVVINDNGAVVHLSVEVTDEEHDNDVTNYDFYLSDVLVY